MRDIDRQRLVTGLVYGVMSVVVFFYSLYNSYLVFSGQITDRVSEVGIVFSAVVGVLVSPLMLWLKVIDPLRGRHWD